MNRNSISGDGKQGLRTKIYTELEKQGARIASHWQNRAERKGDGGVAGSYRKARGRCQYFDAFHGARGSGGGSVNDREIVSLTLRREKQKKTRDQGEMEKENFRNRISLNARSAAGKAQNWVEGEKGIRTVKLGNHGNMDFQKSGHPLNRKG